MIAILVYIANIAELDDATRDETDWLIKASIG